MNRVLRKNDDMIVIVCIDDILIYIQRKDKHADHLMIMFKVLKDQNYVQSLVKRVLLRYLAFLCHIFQLSVDR